MRNRIITLLITAFCLSGTLIAQQIEVSGKVTDAETNEPLIGATISIKNTTRGTSADINGDYSIIVNDPQSAVLVFSFVGYATQEIEYTGQSTINVSLMVDYVQLDDLVVVAYGVARKEAATGSVNMMKTEEIENAMVTSPEKALQGKVAGVQINNFSGQPGGATEIYIRGISSINSGNQPLYVVDGMPVISGNYGYSVNNSNIMSSIDPSDIESITVLKDAAAAAVYGSRAANGVVLITTKSGEKGRTKF